MKAELIDVMGDDLRVVNSARVSFDKESEWEFDHTEWNEAKGTNYPNILSKKDIGLLNYLAKHGHWTPFSHVMLTMRETVPIFVARQRFKHMVGFTYNEVSRRYVDTPPKFFTPDVWRKASENKKQGSSDEEVIDYQSSFPDFRMPLKDAYNTWMAQAKNHYDTLIEAGVCPEQARMVLPQSMYTSYYCTGSLAAWARAYKQRSDQHAQKEIQDLAIQWGSIIGGLPELQHSWAALTRTEE